MEWLLLLSAVKHKKAGTFRSVRLTMVSTNALSTLISPLVVDGGSGGLESEPAVCMVITLGIG